MSFIVRVENKKKTAQFCNFLSIHSLHLPSKPQSEWYRYDKRMLCTVSFETTTISKIIEHIWFYIQAERFE